MGAARAEFRFHGDLVDLVPATVSRTCEAHATVKDQIEAVGVPHPEVAAVTIDGVAAGFDARVPAGAVVDVYPETAAAPGLARATPPRPVPARFVADVHLGRLARILRLLGLDVTYRNDAADADLAQEAAGNRRILLTRDRGLLKRAPVVHGALLRSTDPESQSAEVLRRFDLCGEMAPFSRCLRCGGTLRPVGKADVAHRLPPLTRRHIDEFNECEACANLYWRGAHHDRLTALVDRLLSTACGQGDGQVTRQPGAEAGTG